MKKKKKWLILAILVLLVGGYFWYAKSKSSQTPVRYVTETAAKGSITESVTATGNIIVDSSANIDPTITGTVRNLAVNVGDQVKEGQTLFTIENNDLSVSVLKAQASLASAEASVESAKASQKQAQQDYDDVKDENVALIKKQAAEKSLAAAEASVESAQKGLVSAKSSLRNAQDDASKRTVTSPIDGTVNEINVSNGDDLSKLSSGSSRTVPMIIGDLSTMKAEVEVGETDITGIEIGQTVKMTFDAIDGLTATGKVEKMDSIGTSSSGVVTYEVIIGFDELDSRIKPEMSVDATIIVEEKNDIIAVPTTAIETKGDSSSVKVLNGQNVERKTVTLGISNDTDTEIASGLSVGDKVITQTIGGSTGTSATSSSSSSSSNKNNDQGGGPGGGGMPGGGGPPGM